MIVSGHLIHLHCFFPVLAVYQSRPQSSSAHDGTRVEQMVCGIMASFSSPMLRGLGMRT